MKRRLLLYIALLMAGLLLGRGPGPAPHRQPTLGDALSCIDGDVNGDDLLDLSDPVHLLGFLFRGGEPPVACETAPKPVSTVIVVRHAEKLTGDSDPGLTPEGKARAENLAKVLTATPVKYLIASELRRTQDTLQPLADLKALEVEDIEGAPAVLSRLKELPAGTIAVVAHHSYTIPSILEGLEVEGVKDIDVSGKNYDNFLIVLLPHGGKTQLLHLKY